MLPPQGEHGLKLFDRFTRAIDLDAHIALLCCREWLPGPGSVEESFGLRQRTAQRFEQCIRRVEQGLDFGPIDEMSINDVFAPAK